MIDAAENDEGGAGDPSTPPLASPPTPTDGVTVPYDMTVKLDRAIVERNLSVPTRFGRFEVIERIGIGGFASVFSARDPDLDTTVAIKVLAENHSADVEVRKRFVAEARVARRLGGERLIGVFDLGETDDGRPYVVMELASGGTLRARLQRIGRPSPASLLRLIDELGACMHAVHQKGVVHRDIKPSNLLLRAVDHIPEGRPRELIEEHERLVLADFGLARDISSGASAVTVGGGTAGYMAPEQADPNGKADVRADIYAATVVLAELTTGRHPERLDLPTAEVSDPVREALEQGMAMDREQRPPSAMAWRDSLRAAYVEHGDTDTDTNTDTATSIVPPAGADVGERPHTDLTLPIDATKVHPPHQFRDRADAEYDEAGLETALPHPVSGADPIPPGEQAGPPAVGSPADVAAAVGPSAPTRHLVEPLTAIDPNAGLPGGGTAAPVGGGLPPDPDDDPTGSGGDGRDHDEHRADLDRAHLGHAGVVGGGDAAETRPRMFVRPVIDSEPPPPPPSIPLSPRAQRPPPSATPRHPPAGRDRPGGPATNGLARPITQPAPPTQVRPSVEAPQQAATPIWQEQPAPPLQQTPTPIRHERPARPAQEGPQPIHQPPPPVARPAGEAPRRRPASPAPAGGGSMAGPAPSPVGPPPAHPGPGAGAVSLPPTGGVIGLRPPPGPGQPGPVAPPPTQAEVRRQRRQARRWERRRRWRRRRRRSSNVIRALLRGFLAMVMMAIIARVVLAWQTGEPLNDLSQESEQIVALVGIVSFLLGLRLFPWPRRLDPAG